MTFLLKAVVSLGWRGLLAGAAGLFVGAAAAFPMGTLAEKAACQSRIEAKIATHQLEEGAYRDARIAAALAARRKADHDLDRRADGRLPDDGHARD